MYPNRKTLAPKYPNRDYSEAKVSTIWVYGPLGLGFSKIGAFDRANVVGSGFEAEGERSSLQIPTVDDINPALP